MMKVAEYEVIRQQALIDFDKRRDKGPHPSHVNGANIAAMGEAREQIRSTLHYLLRTAA